MTTIQISVTEADIAAAHTEQEEDAGVVGYIPSCNCPVVRAVRREFPHASVGTTEVGFDGTFLSGRTALLPATARTFIADFDAGREVGPIIFELEVGDGL